uniref:C-type lectin domain-containing protein n=1 Tax=Panagrellus redivivus TaxID=6233 RepID=A0A7E4VJA8_PANRE
MTINAARNCYLLPSRPGRCIHVLTGADKAKCMPTYAGFEYVPTSQKDLEEIRKVLYWRDVKGDKFVTGLWYNKNNNNLFFKNPGVQDNLWESYKGTEHVAPQNISFKNNEQVVIEKSDDAIFTYTMTNTNDVPLLCEASTHPALPCPVGFTIYRPTKRCFKLHTESKTPIEAQNVCRNEFAVMGSINSKAENDYIGKLVSTRVIFIGMRFAWNEIKKAYPKKENIPKGSTNPNFMKTVGKYMYNIDAHEVDYHNFDSNQPDFNTKNEYFIVRWHSGLWHDYPRDHKYNFVCATVPDQTG